jgi:aerobic carbon-monoxide dehydrogenase medium subunit
VVKPATFEYQRPETLEEALAILADDPYETKVLAGGQSLVPMMNFRLARPSRLVDINRIPGLSGISIGDEHVDVRTRTRHLERNGLPGPLGQLLREAASNVGHLPIRTRGTFGGSLAHCDAASEWCLVATLLNAEITATSADRGSRTIDASEFFQSIFTTSLEPDEILTSVRLPMLDDSWVTGIAEFARRAGDFAIIATTAAARVVDGVVEDARVCIGGVSEIPFRSGAAEAVLIGGTWGPDLVSAAAEAAAEEVDPPTDTHGDSEYRRDLVRALLPRALRSPAGQKGA